MSNIIQDKDDLAEVIVAMPFGKLLEVARSLVSMVEDANNDSRLEGRPLARDLSTPLGMAEMLYDWADAQKDE